MVTAPYVAEIVTLVVFVTGIVVIRNPTLLDPAGTVTVAGTVLLGSLLVKVTRIPPTGAGPVSVMAFMPVIGVPPTTVVGYNVIPDKATGMTVTVLVTVMPSYVAEIVTCVLDVTDDVVMRKVGETVWPAGTVTLAGSVTAGLLLLSVTTAPPTGALPFSAR